MLRSIVILTLLAVSSCLLLSAEHRTKLNSAPAKMKMDFENEVRKRGIEKQFSEYQQNVSTKVIDARSAGKCRIRWIEELVRQPLGAAQSAEELTAELFRASGGEEPVLRMLDQISGKLDLVNPDEGKGKKSQQPERTFNDPFDFLTKELQVTAASVDRAFRNLSASEKIELREKIYKQTTTEATLGFRFGGEDRGARLIDLLGLVDLKEIVIAGRHLASLTHPEFLKSLDKQRKQNAGVLREIRTSEGVILVGGNGPNVYKLDRSSDVYAVVDFGGDDVYEEGSVNGERSVFVIIDLKGNDTYRGQSPAIQGGAILGAALLLDRFGNDTYESLDVAQGSSLSGIGILIDQSGNDRYVGDRRVQGQAVNGFGIFLDHSGDDQYRAALFAQGHGGPLGTGILIDRSGEDRYFAGGKYKGPYDDSPGFGSWSQGVGAGAQKMANGGIGVLLDGNGNDIYEADYFSHGGGYWFGAGFARDFEGNDHRLGAVRMNFDGTARSEKRYLRWGIGFGCHYAAGFVFDDRGNDTYRGDWAAIAFAWDFAIGAVFDGQGNDRYDSTGSGVAQARNTGFALLCDLRGTDQYTSKEIANADSEESKLSFAMLRDIGGSDAFHQRVKNDGRAQRGWAGGILLDR